MKLNLDFDFLFSMFRFRSISVINKLLSLRFQIQCLLFENRFQGLYLSRLHIRLNRKSQPKIGTGVETFSFHILASFIQVYNQFSSKERRSTVQISINSRAATVAITSAVSSSRATKRLLGGDLIPAYKVNNISFVTITLLWAVLSCVAREVILV